MTLDPDEVEEIVDEAMDSVFGGEKPAAAAELSLEQALKMRRVAIAGVPRSGKTTMCLETGREVIHTDDLIGKFEWSELSAEVVRMCGERAEFVVEGVRVPHALRKGLEVDVVIWLGVPKVEVTPKQASMGRACRTVFEEWLATSSVPVVLIG